MVLVTGASGFIGHLLVPYLNEAGIRTLSVSRTSEKKIDHYFEPEALESSSVNAIVHLAGKSQNLEHTDLANEYYSINTILTSRLFDSFLNSSVQKFIFISSIKVMGEYSSIPLCESMQPQPETVYGDSKLRAETYLFEKPVPKDKQVIILRPAMVHGPGNNGNLKLLYQFVRLGVPYPLSAYHSRRSFLSLDNFCFVIKELIERNDIPSGVYNLSDDDDVAINDIIRWMSESELKKPSFLKIPAIFINAFARLGDFLRLPFNSERLNKLTKPCVVSNHKIIAALGKPLPLSSKAGLMKTFASFKHIK